MRRDREWITAIAVVVIMMTMAYNVMGLLGVPTSGDAWAMQNGALVGALILLLAAQWDALAARVATWAGRYAPRWPR